MSDHLHNYRGWRNAKVERRPPLFGSVTKKISWLKRLVKYLLVFCAIGLLGSGIVLLGLATWVSRDLPNPNKIIDREIPLTTKIYDRTGKQVLYEIHESEKRTLVELTNIPSFVIEATITAEDREFYQHKGYSLTGIIRSLFKNVTSKNKAGGSTITQQLIKNAILTPEKTYTRKVKELILSYQIEKRFTKDEILKMYFNEIPYGSVIYGIEAASQAFFGKPVKEVSLAEGAVLAAIPKAPTYYSPNGTHADKLFERQQWILDSMAELTYITSEQASLAKKEAIAFTKDIENIIAPHFVMYVKEYLSERYGEKVVGQGGLKVITTLDLEKQKIAEQALASRLEDNKQWGATNASLVSLDATTGQILAMVGSADYFNEDIDGQVNVALRPRQPGSSFKPVVYAAAFTKGYTPETVVFDVVTKFTNYDGKIYEPKNYTLQEHGPVTLRQALAGSLNIPAVKVIYLTGINTVLDLADIMGYTTFKDRWRFGLSLVLGGGEVKLLEHTHAFSAFAQDGEQHRLASIVQITDKEGNVLEEYRDQKTKILDTQIARQINNILSDNNARAFIFGARNFLTLADRPVSAKTGTTNDYHDAWTIGYTPTVVTGVWVGNANNDPMKRGADGSIVAAPIWNAYMSQALAGSPVQYFTPPNTDLPDNPALNGTLQSGIKIKIDRVSGKLATEFTPSAFIEEKTYQQLHSILYYVNKESPRGPSPERPEDDPQFLPWEQAIAEWGEKNTITSENPPTEYDDVHVPSNRPLIAIFSPRQGDTLFDRNMVIDISVTAPRGVQKVEYFLGGKLIGEKYSSPYVFSAFLDHINIPTGPTTLRVVAHDSVGNSNQEFVTLNANLPNIASGAAIRYPASGNILTENDFPLQIVFELSRPENIESLKLYVERPDASVESINSVRTISGNTLVIPWSVYPGPGIYGLSFVVTNKDGYLYSDDKILLEIK